MKKAKVALVFVSCFVTAGGIVSYQLLSSKNSISSNSRVVSELADVNAKENAIESVIESEDDKNTLKQELTFDKQVVTNADFANIYNDFDSLKKESTIVIEGDVTDTSVFMHKVNEDTIPYTIYKLKVSKVFSGDVKVGDVINVAEYGGVVTAEEVGLDVKFPEMSEEEKTQKIYFSFGTPLSVTGDKLLIFGSNKEGSQILDFDEPYYMLVNEYQGKFDFNAKNNSYSRNTPDSEVNVSKLEINADDFNNTFSDMK